MQEEDKKKNNESESESNYEFVTETIKKKPVNKKRMFTKVLHSICLGIVAGLVACVVFAFLAPHIYSRLNPDEPDLIYIPEDEQEDSNEYAQETESNDGQIEQVGLEIEELNVENAADDEEDAEESNSTPDTDSEAGKEEVLAEDTPSDKDKNPEGEITLNTEADNSDSSEEADNSDSSRTLIIKKEKLTLNDYRTFYSELNVVASVAKRALTSVKGVSDSTDWFNNSYETGNISTGLIVADNGKELLIITNSGKLVNAKEIEVTFCDGRTYNGTIKKSDSATDLVVIAVVLNDIEDVTKNSYATAVLGNSMLPAVVGEPVIAIGAPLGIEDSMAVGAVTSNTRSLEHTDNNIRYLTTDIYGSTEGSGVLINLDGRVLGIIFNGGISSDAKNLIHAYSISDIKSKVEKMVNGQDSAYLGIIGTDVTKEAMEELSVPEGAYVKQVVVDSPAMKGGIQNGDVIVKIGTTRITSFKDFKQAINKCQPGDTTMVTIKRLGKDGYVEFSYEINLEALK